MYGRMIRSYRAEQRHNKVEKNDILFELLAQPEKRKRLQTSHNTKEFEDVKTKPFIWLIVLFSHFVNLLMHE